MSETLRHKTVKGMIWSAIDLISGKGVGFLVTLVMARLLCPADYGLLGLIGIFSSLSWVMIDGGIWQAIVRNNNRTEEDFTTMFCFNLAVSVVVYIILFFAAPYIADFFGYPLLCPVTRVMMLSLVIGSLNMVQGAKLHIDLAFKEMTRLSFFTSVASGIVGIAAAYIGWGVWALVVQQLSGSVVWTILVCNHYRWRPTAPFSMQSLRNMFSFGSKVALTSVLHIVYVDLANLFIGRVYSPGNLGLYTRAQHFAIFPINSLGGVLDRVTYPVFCKIGDDDQRIKDVLFRYLRTNIFLILPCMMVIAAVAKPMIALLLGPAWAGSALLLPILCVAYMWAPITNINISVWKIKGRSGLMLKVEIIKKSLGIILLFVALPLGIKAVCYSLVISYLLSLFIEMYSTTKVLDITIREQLRCVLPALLLSVVVALVVAVVCSLISNNILALVSSGIIAVALYLGLAKLFRMKALSELKLSIKTIKQ